METLQVQSVGKMPAKPASQLELNDLTMWNFGSIYRVNKFIAETKAFITVELVEIKTNKTWLKRLKKSRLVAIPNVEQFRQLNYIL